MGEKLKNAVSFLLFCPPSLSIIYCLNTSNMLQERRRGQKALKRRVSVSHHRITEAGHFSGAPGISADLDALITFMWGEISAGPTSCCTTCQQSHRNCNSGIQQGMCGNRATYHILLSFSRLKNSPLSHLFRINAWSFFFFFFFLPSHAFELTGFL